MSSQSNVLDLKKRICVEGEIYLTPEQEQDLQARLSRIEGHIRGIKRMLAEHKDCESLLIQVAAVKAAINQVGLLLLEGHMETCVAEAVEQGHGVEALNRLKGALTKILR